MNNPYFHEKFYESRKRELDMINREGWKHVKPFEEMGALSRLIVKLASRFRGFKKTAAARIFSSGRAYREINANRLPQNDFHGSLSLQAVRVVSKENTCRKTPDRV